jgi:hypothetical protein
MERPFRGLRNVWSSRRPRAPGPLS